MLIAAAQTTQLILDLQTLAQNAGHPVPLLIALDQENGGCNSLYDEANIRQFPSAMGMAATGNKQLLKYIARATAQELGSCGINWILGPVLDVLSNTRNQPLGVRSFGEDPADVSALGVEQMKGYQEGGLATCGKHFPSYGNLEFLGSPTDVPTITDSLENLSQNALVPFRNAIGAGIDAMMVGGVAMTSNHINVMHACLSEQICRDLLRDQMKFQGVVVSECLEMEALSRNIGISGGTVMAFKAGCDLIVTCRTLGVQEEAINGLKTGLDNGMIERYRVQESWTRIMALKNRYTSWEQAFNPKGVENLRRLQPIHSKLSATAYNNSITVVRDEKRYLQLSKTIQQDDELLLLTPLIKPLPASAASRHPEEDNRRRPISPRTNHDHGVDTSVMAGERVFREFGRALARRRNGKVSHTSYTANGIRPQHENLLDRAKAVIIVTADAGRNKYQSAFAKHVAMLCRFATDSNRQIHEKPCIHIAVSSPFDFNTDESIGTYICTYDFTETALQALVKILYDDVKPTGTLPGTTVRIRRPSVARQQWLVESFRNDRDASALDALLEVAQTSSKTSSTLLKNTSAKTFLLADDSVEEAHFVVRNSTTRELLGFCATYYHKFSGEGHIGIILVDPARRHQSIGHSLHDRAIRALLQKPSPTQFRLGSHVPNVFLGIPKADLNDYKKLRQWFAKLGWNVSQSRPVCRMAIPDLSTWTPPDGLGQNLTHPDIKYDLVHGNDYAEPVMAHVSTYAPTDVQLLYKMALSNKEGCAIIRGKRGTDGAIIATVLLYRNESKLAPLIPQVKNPGANMGGIGSPVLASDVPDRTTLLQGLVLLGVRQLKRQGIGSLVLDYVG